MTEQLGSTLRIPQLKGERKLQVFGFVFFFALSSFWFGWDPAVGKLHCYGVHHDFDVLEGRAVRRAGVTPSTNRGWGGGE